MNLEKLQDLVLNKFINLKAENIDFIGLSQKSEKPQGGRPIQDHALKLDMAKEISI